MSRIGWPYLWTLLLVAALSVAAFLVATEIVIRVLVMPNEPYERHIELLRTTTSGSVVLGDSQLSRSITGLPGVLNLAYASDTIESMQSKAALYFAETRPERVIIEAAPQFFSRRRLMLANPVAEIAASGLEVLRPRRRGRLLRYWVTLLTEGGFRSRFTFTADGAELSHDSFADLNSRERAAMAVRRTRAHAPVENFFALDVVGGYETLVAGLQDSGARLCLVGPPVTPEYRLAAAAISEIEAARVYFRELARRLGVPLRDYWAATDDVSLFADSDHLNAAGARWFSARVGRDCFGPELGEEPQGR